MKYGKYVALRVLKLSLEVKWPYWKYIASTWELHTFPLALQLSEITPFFFLSSTSSTVKADTIQSHDFQVRCCL